MTNEISLVNLGEWSNTANVLIEKISDAIGGLAKPWQIRRVARAEAEVEKLKAEAQIEITEIHRRAIQRFIAEEANRQHNIESIIAKALPQVTETGQPQNMENDWITNFFDKCRLISDEEMQTLWASVLAGEANSPGSYSKRTVNFLNSIDKSDATLFQSLCDFCWEVGNYCPLIYDYSLEIYSKHGIDFSSLTHLDEIGLISFSHLSGYRRIKLPQEIQVAYYETPIIIKFRNDNDNDMDTGKVMLSKVGQELAPICSSEPIPEFFDYILEKWMQDMNLVLLSPI